MKRILPLLLLSICLWSLQACTAQKDDANSNIEQTKFSVHPIHHATMVLSWNDTTIYVDPTGGAEAFATYKSPDLILITDIHPDHFNTETLNNLNTQHTVFVVPQAVADKMPASFSEQLVILDNGKTTKQAGIKIHAIPMYNLPQNKDAYHPKGRGNGYVLTRGNRKIYIAGDTEDIPEMRALENIDIAFIPMNLPYTMTVEQAADAVLEFKPAVVYPYHYKGSDIQKFKQLVNEGNSDIEVRLKDWYPNS